jgi:hypothetical protein
MTLAEEYRANRLGAVEKENARLLEEIGQLKRQIEEMYRLYQSSTKRRHTYRQCLSMIQRLVEEVDQ